MGFTQCWDIINFHTPGFKDPSANVNSTMSSSKKPYLRYANLTITFRELPTHSAVCFIREAGVSSGIIPEGYAISVETDGEDKEKTSYLERREPSADLREHNSQSQSYYISREVI